MKTGRPSNAGAALALQRFQLGEGGLAVRRPLLNRLSLDRARRLAGKL